MTPSMEEIALKGMLTIDIDSGSTFTDCFVTNGLRYVKVKVDTTPHDLALCFFDALKEAAKAIGVNDVKELVKKALIIRYVTTHGTNTFIMRTGDKVGVLVTKGYEKGLYAEEENNPIFNYVSKDMVIGLDEKVDDEGKVVKPVNEEEVLNAVKKLLDLGARILVVSFKNAHLNPNNERRVREIIRKYYKPHYLGFIPLILASEFCKRRDEATRTNLALLNTYIHRLMASFLYRVEDELRTMGYRRPLMTVHINGGVVSISKTRPIDTVGSSPVAGMMGSLYWSKVYGAKNVVTIEMGGASFDVGLIVNGIIHSAEETTIFGVPVKVPMVEVSSFGLAGGSIVKVDMEGNLRIGPESAGILPGPACYDAGGVDPTVLDANVILGRINPEYFLGGRRKLNVERARQVFEEKVASILGISVEDAALRVIESVAELGSTFIKDVAAKVGGSLGDYVAFVYGGSGPVHSAEISERLGISKIYVFPFSPVFGAFSSSMMDVLHIYEDLRTLPLAREGEPALPIGEFNNIAKMLMENAYKDLEGEGFTRQDVSFELELEVKDNSRGEVSVIPSQKVLLDGMEDVKNILSSYQDLTGRREISGMNLTIELFRLRAKVTLPHFKPTRFEILEVKAEEAVKGERLVRWLDGKYLTKVYDFNRLKPGMSIKGPAIIESVDTTYVVPKGWRFMVDGYLNGVMEKVEVT